MTGKGRGSRQIRKQILRYLEETFDLQRLDYRKRTAPLKHAAMVTGLMTAGVIYGLGFGLAYYAWKAGTTDYETFGKFVWIFMIPSSVIGIFTYLLSRNRKEFAVAKDILAHIEQVEGADGMLWRYEPIFAVLQDDELARQMVSASREGLALKIEPEDYAQVVRKLHEVLQGGEGPTISDEALERFEHNLAGEGS